MGPSIPARGHDHTNGAHHAAPFAPRSAMSDYRREEAINETRSRQTNEWIQQANDRFGADRAMDEYRCECSDGDCADVLSLTRAEYEAVRADGLRFIIATHHENPELDRLVISHERYSVVSKLPGEPARIALDSDPRRG
jgi:hypothetical protein